MEKPKNGKRPPLKKIPLVAVPFVLPCLWGSDRRRGCFWTGHLENEVATERPPSTKHAVPDKTQLRTRTEMITVQF
eukprot:5060285-Amphidinium_carterae.1